MNNPIEIRELKVAYQCGGYADRLTTKRPQIKLAGVWLSEAGFHYQDKLLVKVEYGRLVIENLSCEDVPPPGQMRFMEVDSDE